jgi:hypothetical protein
LFTGSPGLFHGTTKLDRVRVPQSRIWQVGVFGKDLVTSLAYSIKEKNPGKPSTLRPMEMMLAAFLQQQVR